MNLIILMSEEKERDREYAYAYVRVPGRNTEERRIAADMEELTKDELQIKIKRLRKKERRGDFTANDKALLAKYIHELSQIMIKEGLKPGEKVVEETREKIDKEIMELTNPENDSSGEGLIFDVYLEPEKARRIYDAAEEVMRRHLSVRDETRTQLARKISRDLHCSLEAVEAWISLAEQKIISQRGERAIAGQR